MRLARSPIRPRASAWANASTTMSASIQAPSKPRLVSPSPGMAAGPFGSPTPRMRLDWLRHTLSPSVAPSAFNIELVDTARVRALHPFYNLDGVLGALHTPDDGHVDPSGVTQGAGGGRPQAWRKNHPPLPRHRQSNSIAQLASGSSHTEHGAITSEHVVNAGGTYARQMGELVRPSAADDLDDPSLFRHRHRARVYEPGSWSCR